MKRKKRSFEIFSLSFLDVVSCGFGAIVLLLVIVKISEPDLIEQKNFTLKNEIASLREQNLFHKSASKELAKNINIEKRHIETRKRELIELREKYTSLQDSQVAAEIVKKSQESLIRQLFSAKQDLTEEMQRLQRSRTQQLPDSLIGGIPVDSEFILFVIDTSGSMQEYGWKGVRRRMDEILKIYPHVQGIQIMNDMGDYMFPQYSGRWIPDTPARRKAILNRLHSWRPFSNSSPVEGVTAAIRRFYRNDQKMSIYIFGDDFSRGSIQEVVDIVDRINVELEDGSRRVRIHAVGFPVLFDQPNAQDNVARFAALMRRLAEDNNGSFVGLTELQ